MASFDQLLKDPVALCAALEAISIEGKLRADLQRLYDSADGIASGRDDEQRVTGDTVRSCNAIGTRLGKQLRIKLPHDAMMWLGTVKRDAVGRERWVMRAEIRAVLKRLGWFGPGPMAVPPARSRQRGPSRSEPVSAAPPRALILAAGRGERMRPLTDTCPKPLLKVHGKPLIEYHLEALARAGVREVVINTAWLEEQFPATLGDGQRWGLTLHYSMEGRDHGGALETAGGIVKALPLLAPRGTEAFWVVSGDVHVPEFAFDAAQVLAFEASHDTALLWVVPNPSFNPRGDFSLAEPDRLLREPENQPRPWTYANLALVRPALVAGLPAGQRAAMGPLLFASAHAGRLAGRVLKGPWENLGTPAQLAALNA